MVGCKHLTPLLSVLMAACSIYIDDFEVEADGSVPDENTPDNTDPSSGDGDTAKSGSITCGISVETPAGTELAFCEIDEGTFDMGCDPEFEDCIANEEPMHSVRTAAFGIARYETTIDAYRAFIADVPEWGRNGADATTLCDTAYLHGWTDDVPPAGTLNQPVLGVCWYAADAFCKWLGSGYRLPTEAEWERVARGTSAGTDGGEYRKYPFDGEPRCAMANYQGCAGKAVDVGTNDGLSFGKVYDMGGNAWEWVADWYDALYYCDPQDGGIYLRPDCDESFEWRNPTGPSTGNEKVVRGGSWAHDMTLMRNATRERLAPENSSNITGFRCAYDN